MTTSRNEYVRTYNLPKLLTITIAASLLVPHNDSLSAFDPRFDNFLNFKLKLRRILETLQIAFLVDDETTR
jgi:hypothetical protein